LEPTASLTTARSPSGAQAWKREKDAAEKRVSAVNHLLEKNQVALQDTKDAHRLTVASINESHENTLKLMQQDNEAKLVAVNRRMMEEKATMDLAHKKSLRERDEKHLRDIERTEE
jgi:hypothetical protein